MACFLIKVNKVSPSASYPQLAANTLSGGEQRYFFTIRGRGRNPAGVDLPDDAVALSYAEHKVRELRTESGYDDPALMMIVKDEARQIVWSLPFFPGC